MWQLLFLVLVVTADDNANIDGEASRKVLGSSVVTSVSVIMDNGNGSKIYTDAVGKPVSKPLIASDVASPINLLNPDRYEFYTFDDSGDLVKRLMTLEEIQDIIASGDGDGFNVDDFTSNGFIPEKRVNDVVNNVQNVLKEEIKVHKHPPVKPQLDTPDVSDSWSMILPAVFGNSGEAIKPEPASVHVTPDTIMIEPTVTPKPILVSTTPQHLSTTDKVLTAQPEIRPVTSASSTPLPTLNVEINSNSNSTTGITDSISKPSNVVEIKPVKNNLELTKDNSRPIFHVNRKSTKKPEPFKVTTFRPVRSTTAFSSTTPKTTTEEAKIATTTSTTTTQRSTTEEPKTTTTTSKPTIKTKLTTTSTTTTTKKSTSAEPSSTTTILESTTTSPGSSLSTESKLIETKVTDDSLIQTETSTTEQSISQQTETIALTTTTADDIVSTAKIESTSTSKPITTSKLETITNLNDVSITVQDSTTENNEKTTVREFVTTEAITETPTIPQITESDDLPSLLQILHSFHAQSYATEKTNEETTTAQAETPSTLGGLSTFFIVSDNKKVINPDTTTEIPTTVKESEEDLSTLGTEHFTRKTQRDPTTERDSTEKSTTLDQFLLTSTNIYEINSQLAEKTTIKQLDSEETTTNKDLEVGTTEKFYIKLKEPSTQPPATTTDLDFVDTIEQLISQAVGTSVEPPIENDLKTVNKIEAMMLNSSNKTMPEVLTQTASLASDLIDANASTATETSTEAVTTTEMDLISDDLLNDSVEMLLSQVQGSEESTTVISTTEQESTTTLEPLIDFTTKKREIQSTTIKSDDDSHIINITIIRNENRKNQSFVIAPKPAKADLSLEMEYEDILKEIQQNSTFLSLAVNQTRMNVTSSPVEEPESTTGFDVETVTVDESTTEPVKVTVKPTTTEQSVQPSVVITINENNKNNSEENASTWTLVSTLSPHVPESTEAASTSSIPPPIIDSNTSPVDLVPKPLQGFGLEDSTAHLDSDIYQFVQLCNELAFGFFKSVTTGISSARSVVISPFAATSLLAMVFLGARGATSGEMNEILKLDDMVTFNPHLIFKNVSESIEANADSGVAASAIVRELYSDRSKGKLLNFYKDRVRQFYDGHVEEASFREIGDVIRRRTNLLVKKSTNGKIAEFLKDSSIVPKPPLAGISASIFHTDCSQASTDGRDGELYFVVLPSIRQRRLIPIPATVYRSGFLAGYEPSLDATAAALGTKDQIVSTIFIIPGQQGMAAPGDGLARLEKRLIESSFRQGAWSRLLRSLIPRPGLELQIPRFLHRSLINSTYSLKKMGLHELFDSHKADLKGLNGAAHELHLSEVLQVNEFATCGEDRIGEAHHKEVYPATTERKSRLLLGDLEEPRDYQRAFHDPLHDPSYLSLPLPLRPRQARLPEAPRLRFDRPFLYIVRHNPSGLILHMGRFHPRLLP